ncbi:hypothetical protein EDD94_1428 [Streptomyces sp. PanSC9]|nr:hypothetical protein EDD94_1428 [Streptomyces sp. PanSC9]
MSVMTRVIDSYASFPRGAPELAAAVPECASRDGELRAVRSDGVGSGPDAGEKRELPVI